MPRGVYVRSAQARANMSAAAKNRAKKGTTATPAVKGAPRRTMKTPTPQGPRPGTPVGYGRKGHAFYSTKNYAKSVEGKRHAKDPNLKTAPVRGPGGKIIRGKKGNVFFNPAKAKAAQAKARAAHSVPASTGPHKIKVPVARVSKGAGSGRIPKGKK